MKYSLRWSQLQPQTDWVELAADAFKILAILGLPIMGCVGLTGSAGTVQTV